MADFQFNISKGRAVELYNRVKTGDPADSALLLVVLAEEDVESDAVLKDKDTLADVLAGATNEATNGGYVRKVLTAADLGVLSPDDANDRIDLDIPDQTWTNVLPGSNWAKIAICYRPATESADSEIIPLTSHDFPMIPDGSNMVAQIDSVGFFRAV
ncbi:hypothetical protein [Streptosporangium lutulentum]|uniref:Uncharacterized protein n=1 Tax=Streptosporangium lutulentum TaxID=1461250 RepID=A0ABT9Q970_9ACTN|nr:hypothetical protein [Streptosporangium lutulentum]MDP9843269.1 hypothetical protein [Streptosporangium lutulentum]